jgi:hypothetical protein
VKRQQDALTADELAFAREFGVSLSDIARRA